MDGWIDITTLLPPPPGCRRTSWEPRPCSQICAAGGVLTGLTGVGTRGKEWLVCIEQTQQMTSSPLPHPPHSQSALSYSPFFSSPSSLYCGCHEERTYSNVRLPLKLWCTVFLVICLPSDVSFGLTLYCYVVVLLHVLAEVTKVQ